METNLSPSLLTMIPRPPPPPPPPSDCSEKPSSDRHFVTWTDQEDDILRNAVGTYGTEKWSIIAAQFHDKTSRQCRRRWNTYLSVDFKKGGWSPEEDQLLLEAQRKFGNRWTEIAKVVPGRTDNAVKNRFSALGKKEAKKLEVLSNQSNAEGGKTASCRRVLEPISNIIKRSRLDDCRNELTGQQKQGHLQNRKTIQMWKTEQSMAERAHPVHTRRPLKSLAHYDLKPPQHFKTVQRDANVVKKPVMNEDFFQEVITPPRLPPALSQNVSLVDSVDDPDVTMKLVSSDGAWKQFDWATKEITKNLQTSNYESEHQKHGEVSKTSFEEKDPYYSLYGSQILSVFPIDKDQHHDHHDVGISTPILLRERSWRIRSEPGGLECSPPSNIGSLQGDDSTSAQNECFSSVHLNEAITAGNEIIEGIYSNTDNQGLDCEEGNGSLASMNTSVFCNVSTSLDFTWYSGCVMDDIPSPQFSDSEKLFLLSAFD